MKVLKIISMCAVPGKLRLKEPHSTITSCTILDNCSHGISKTHLLKELKVHGIETPMKINIK